MYQLDRKLSAALESSKKADIPNILGQIYHIPSRNLDGFLLELLIGTLLNEMLNMEKVFIHFFSLKL